jgi:hypothetical protein
VFRTGLHMASSFTFGLRHHCLSPPNPPFYAILSVLLSELANWVRGFSKQNLSSVLPTQELESRCLSEVGVGEHGQVVRGGHLGSLMSGSGQLMPRDKVGQCCHASWLSQSSRCLWEIS